MSLDIDVARQYLGVMNDAATRWALTVTFQDGTVIVSHFRAPKRRAIALMADALLAGNKATLAKEVR